MNSVFICDGIRTPVGRYGGGLSSVRTDDLAAHPLKVLAERNPSVDWAAVDDLYFGCANQAGEDNRNVGRMAALLAGLPQEIPAATVNRLCGSGLEAVGLAARAVVTGEAGLALAGGVESMSRAPFVMPKSATPFSRNAEIYDTTIGWRFVNKALQAAYGTDSMPETAENLAADMNICREDQDGFAYRSQMRARAAMKKGRFDREIAPVIIPQRKGEDLVVAKDEHPRPGTTLEALAGLKAPFRAGGTVTAGNASGTNDGAAALLLAGEKAVQKYGLAPMVRVVGMTSAGVPPRTMGYGPVPATQKLLSRLGLALADIDIIELNEAFAAQSLACLRGLGLPDDAAHVNPNGGAIALGHPLGMSGARIALTLAHEMADKGARYGLATMCIGVGQGIAMVLERA